MWGFLAKVIFVIVLLLTVDDALARRDHFSLTVICKLGEGLCADGCYSKSTQNCFNNTVCKKDDRSACGKTCVPQKSKQVCHPSPRVMELDTLCNSGQGACAGKCYSNKTHACLSDVLCTKGQAACGDTCYNPKDPKQCLSDPEHGSFLCGKSEKACGNLGCYSPKAKVCIESELGIGLCKVGQAYCDGSCKKPDACLGKAKGAGCKAGTVSCGSECYATGKKVCFNNETLCNKGEKLCGSECYAPGKKLCLNDTLCDAGQVLCGTECYKPSKGGDQCIDIGDNESVLCPKGQQACRYACFDPKTQACISEKTVCPKGEELCSMDCFNPSKEQCFTMEPEDVLCASGDALCGRICYKPGVADKVCMENSTLCAPKEKPCDEKCFNPKTQVCFKNVYYNPQGLRF